MGAKSLYIDNRRKYREQIVISKNLKAQFSLQRGIERYKKYSCYWETLNLDEIVNKLFKNPIYRNEGEKFIITDASSKYIIYCDNGGSYFRIGNKDIPVNHKGHYLNSKLESVLNEVVNGKITGMEKNKRDALTHFKMKIIKEL